MATNEESKQRYLGRNRPPRVHITYDVEIGNASETTELPLVVGILSDLSGNVTPTVPVSLGKRGFVDIDRDSFDVVLKRINPQLSFKVENILDDASEQEREAKMQVDLSFESFEDFSPERIVAKVAGLKDLYDKRQKLQDLLIKLDGNVDLISKSAELADSKKLKTFQDDLALALGATETLALTYQRSYDQAGDESHSPASGQKGPGGASDTSVQTGHSNTPQS
jgi:type VI secretion system protein ImpB